MLVTPNPPSVMPPPVRMPLSGGPCCSTHCFALVPTAWGDCAVVWKNHEDESDAEGFCQTPAHALLTRILVPGLAGGQMRSVILGQHPACDEVLGDRGGQFHPETVPPWFGRLVGFLQAYYGGGLREWSRAEYDDHWSFWPARLDWSGLTEFQRCVLLQVGAIRHGQTMTYGQVAARLGKPRASRAVGAAVGNNPWPVLVPCHRVMGHGGRLTGFSAPGGVGTKRRMLVLESGLLVG